MSIQSINLKTVTITLFMCVAIAVMSFLHYRAVTKYSSLGQTRVLVGDLYANMLTLRRNEKDFLTRKDLQYSQKFLDNYKKTIEHLQVLRSRLHENDIDDIQLNLLAKNFDSYKNRFIALVELQKEIGLSHQDGLNGSMRDAIHQVEDLLTARQHNQLNKDMLMLRRREKDFMLRNDIKYIGKFNEDMAEMQLDLSRAHLHPEVKRRISTALATYEVDFKALASATQKKGFSSDEGLQGEMRRSAHEAERILEELRQEALLLIGHAGSYVITQIAVFAAVLILLMITLVFLPRKKYSEE